MGRPMVAPIRKSASTISWIRLLIRSIFGAGNVQPKCAVVVTALGKELHPAESLLLDQTSCCITTKDSQVR